MFWIVVGVGAAAVVVAGGLGVRLWLRSLAQRDE
jgi:hypothetical protein